MTRQPLRLRPADLARVASVGLRTRKLRASLSALGIAIGVAAIVAVLGLSTSSQAGLLAEIDALGTNLLTVTNGQTLAGGTAELPVAAPGMISRIGPVTAVQDTGTISGVSAYRNPRIPAVNTNGLAVRAATLGLPQAVATSVAQGSYLNAATAAEPVAVLGAAAATRLGIDRIYPGERIWVGHQWFYLAGILKPAILAPEVDTSVLIGFQAARTYLGFDGHPSTHLRPGASRPGQRRLRCPRRDREPRVTQRRHPQPAVGRARRPGQGQERLQRAVPGPRRGRAPGRRGGSRQHHGHLGSRTPLRDRAPAR